MNLDPSRQLPLVSVVLTTYRNDTLLHRALSSLLAQTYPKLQIVVVDDNCDSSWSSRVNSVVRSACSAAPEHSAPPVQLIVNPKNIGSSASRNVGISASDGEFITFLDDDDVYLPQKVTHQVSAMLEQGADFSLTDLVLLKENGRLAERRKRPYLVNADRNRLFLLHLMYHMTGTGTLMFRKQYLLEIGCFDRIDLGDEFYLMNKAILRGGRFCYVPCSDVQAYIHTGETGLSSGQTKLTCENQLYQFKQRYFSEIDPRSRRYIVMRHYAVLAFAALRMRAWGSFLKNGMLSFLSSPLQCCGLLLGRKL